MALFIVEIDLEFINKEHPWPGEQESNSNSEFNLFFFYKEITSNEYKN